MKPTDPLYLIVLKAYTCPYSVKSDFARLHAGHVAQACIEGYITTRHLDGRYGQTWYVTLDGLQYLEDHA